MGYTLERHETPEEGIKRIMHEQVNDALDELSLPLEDPDDNIHEVRKDLKKLRAALRLVRDEIGNDTYKRENVFYRDLGRQFAEVRDSYVAVETLDDLIETYSDQLQEGAFHNLRDGLCDIYNTHAQLFEREDILKQAHAALEDAHRRIDDLPIQNKDFSAFYDSLRRVYKRGYKRMHDAYAHPTPERFHEWRKRVKYLWYHTRILQPMWDDVLDEFGDAIHDLSDYLGDAHDLAELARVIEDQPPEFATESERRIIKAIIKGERSQLEQDAWGIAQRIYAESKSDFTDRHARYWYAWQEE